MMHRLLPLYFLVATAMAVAADFLPLDRAVARQLLNPENHRQPTVVALWSADCGYCKQNLQLLSRLAKSNKRLRVITVAAEPASAQHGPMLSAYALSGARYAYGSDSPEAIAYALDPSWAGELPRTFMFNGAGHQEKVSGVISVATVEKATGLRF